MSNEFIVIPPEDRNLKIIDYNDYNAVHNAGETDESLFNGMLTILETTSLNSFLLHLIFFTQFFFKWPRKIYSVLCQSHKKTII